MRPNDTSSWTIPSYPRVLEVIFYGVLLFYLLFLLVTAWKYSWDERLFPYLIGTPVLLLLIFQLIILRFPKIESQLAPTREPESTIERELDEQDDHERPPDERRRYEALMLLWVLALPLFIYLVGFAYGIPIYIFAFGWYFLKDIRIALIMSVGFSLVFFLLFILILGMSPWNGILGLPNPIYSLSSF